MFLACILLAMALGIGIVFASRVGAETIVTPSLSLSERYDSNIYNSAPSNIPPGRKSWDLITTAGANVEVKNKSRLGDSVLFAGVNGNKFTYAQDLSFVSTNVFASSDMTGWVSELARGLQLRISDSFVYTPEPLAFFTGGQPSQTADSFSRGIQGVRANTYKNILRADSDYSLSRSFGLRTNYAYSIFRVGSLYTTVSPSVIPISYSDTTQHSVNTGPTFTFDGGDTLFFKYNYTSGETKGETKGGITRNYVFQTIAPEYVSHVVPGWTLMISAGGTLVESLGNRVFFSGKLGLATDYDRRTRVDMSVSRQAAPLFFSTGGGAMISNVAQLTISHGLSRVVRLTISGNYAHNESTPVKTFVTDNIMGSANLEYKLTRSVSLALSEVYNHIDYSSVTPFDKSVTMLTLRTEWK